jgi:hypothetical protein
LPSGETNPTSRQGHALTTRLTAENKKRRISAVKSPVRLEEEHPGETPVPDCLQEDIYSSIATFCTAPSIEPSIGIARAFLSGIFVLVSRLPMPD